MKAKLRAGFTLVEMLVVIAIILILLALMAVLIKGVRERAQYKKTVAIVNTIKMGCENYRTDERVYPPQTYSTYNGSQALHFLLGRERNVVAGTGGSQTVVKRDPYIEFKPDWLEGQPGNNEPNPPKNVVDAWGNVIAYNNPKPGAPVNPPSFLLLSTGKDTTDAADDVRSDRAED